MKEANILIALSFKDFNDPRYKAIGELVTQTSMWKDNNIVHIEVFDTRDELVDALEDLTSSDEGWEL